MSNMIEELLILDNNRTIFDTGARYVIPRYQRAYAWEDTEIIQLIDDIAGISKSENYYIGSLVVSKVRDKANTFEVVDGQQRLTTLYLLLQYLVSESALEEAIEPALTFDCRASSNFTLSHIQEIIADKVYTEEEERIEQSILNGLKVIQQKFSTDETLNIEDFVCRLKHVILYRIEVPENTDLNRYFEIMNTRGEQLEQHDILKAQIMANLPDKGEQDFFARVWDACSDMTGYVQMHFSRHERECIFSSDWNTYPSEDWDDYEECFQSQNDKETGSLLTIKDIVTPAFVVDDTDGTLDNDTHIRFDSIIDFPYFLLHVIRVYVNIYDIQAVRPFGDLLDDKKLIADFKNVLDSEDIDATDFARRFIVFLLQARYLFDAYFIKREYTGEDKDGEWSLKELHTSGQASKKKPYYKNTLLRKNGEWESTSNERCKESLMIQAALRVSYTSPKVMHWITSILDWLFDSDWDEIVKLSSIAENIAKEAVDNNFLKGENFVLGVSTPHVVFNFLDYLLWKADKRRYADFNFEFRNSVEHWYPQHPSDGTFESWENKDTFGNLCIVSRSVNSKFSNLSPESKMKSYGKMVRKGSLKLRLMGEIIENCKSEEWKQSKCEEHELEMLNVLRNSIQPS